MQEMDTAQDYFVSEAVWNDVQSCLSSLSPYSIIIYDPEVEKLCTARSRSGILNHLLLEKDEGSPCIDEFRNVVNRAVASKEIHFSKCQDGLDYFVIPVAVSHDRVLLIVAGLTGLEKESLPNWEAAAKLQAAGRILLVDVCSQNRLGDSSPVFPVLDNLSELFEIDQAAIKQNVSILFEALGTLFHVDTAAVFYQNQKGAAHRAIAVFGEMKEKLRDLKVEIDFLFRPHKLEKPYVTVNAPYELSESGLPASFIACTIFSLYEGEGTTLTLAILNSSLSENDIARIVSLCKKTGTMHENIKLKSQLTRYKKTIQSLSNFKKMIESPRHFELFYEKSLELALKTLQAGRGSLMILDEDKKGLAIKAIEGCDRSLLSPLSIKPGEGIAGKVFEIGKGVLVEDLNQSRWLRQKSKSSYRTASFISAPIKQKEQTIGLINVSDRMNGVPFSEEDLAVLEAIGGYIAMALERSELYKITKELKRISITDPLTGLLNRRTFHERLLEEIERTRRHQVPVSLIMLDLDDFKAINDTYGHQKGDEMLKELSNAIRQYIRSIDVPSRYGGEEFTVILPQTRKEDAWIIADRLCKGIAEKGERLKKDTEAGQLAVSVGLATFPDDAASMEELIRNADRALYQAKLQGKNRAIAFNKNAFI